MKTRTVRLGIATWLLFMSIAAVWIVAVSARAAEKSKQAEQATTRELNRLLKIRSDIAANLLDAEEKKLSEGRTTLMNVYEAARRVRDSALELTDQPDEQEAALKRYLDVVRRLEESVNSVVEKGAAPASDKDLVRYLRLDAEIALLKTKLQSTPK